MEAVFRLFEQFSGARPNQYRLLSGSGSDRVYYRLWDQSQTYIGVYGADIQENKAFFAVTNQMEACGIPTPKIL